GVLPRAYLKGSDPFKYALVGSSHLRLRRGVVGMRLRTRGSRGNGAGKRESDQTGGHSADGLDGHEALLWVARCHNGAGFTKYLGSPKLAPLREQGAHRAHPGWAAQPPRCGSVEDAELLRPACRLDARVDAELVEDVREVRADRLLADEEPAGDLAVGHALGQQPQHIGLSRRQLAGLTRRRGRRRRGELEACAAGPRLNGPTQRRPAERRPRPPPPRKRPPPGIPTPPAPPPGRAFREAPAPS